MDIFYFTHLFEWSDSDVRRQIPSCPCVDLTSNWHWPWILRVLKRERENLCLVWMFLLGLALFIGSNRMPEWNCHSSTSGNRSRSQDAWSTSCVLNPEIFHLRTWKWMSFPIKGWQVSSKVHRDFNFLSSFWISTGVFGPGGYSSNFHLFWSWYWSAVYRIGARVVVG